MTTRPLTLLVVAILLAASVVAAGMVPDPSWIAGVYDGLDGDEALSLVWERGEATSPAGLDALTVSSSVFVPPPWLVLPQRSLALPTPSRAPPSA